MTPEAKITCDNCDYETEVEIEEEDKLEVAAQAEAASHVIEGDCPYGSTNIEYGD